MRNASSMLNFFVTFTFIGLCTIFVCCRAQKLQENDECHIITFLPFTDLRDPVTIVPFNESIYGYGNWPDAETLAKASYSYLASAEMARNHFNTRNAIIVPELATLGDCNITIPMPVNNQSWYFNSAYSRSKTVQHYLGIQQERKSEAETGDIEAAPAKICAVIGPVDNGAHEGLSVLTEFSDIPQIAFATISDRLDRSLMFPSFVRVNANVVDFSKSIGYYVQRDIFQRNNVAIFYDQSEYGEQFEIPIESLEDEIKFHLLTSSFVEGDETSIRHALKDVVEYGYRTIVFIAKRPTFVEEIAHIADDMGLTGKGYLWIMNEDAMPPETLKNLQYEVGSPMDKLLKGAAVISNYDKMYYLQELGGYEDHPFLKEWRRNGPDFVRTVNNLVPKDDSTGDPYYTVEDLNYFRNEQPGKFASFVYDSVMAAGIGACRAQKSIHPYEKTFGVSTKLSHRDAILTQQLTGASGDINFPTGSSSRHGGGVVFGAHNIRAGPVGKDGMRSYTSELTSLFSYDYMFEKDGVNTSGAWKNIEGKKFIFSDGTTNEPMPKRSVANSHYLNYGIRIGGMTMIVLAVLIAAASALWVFLYRKERSVSASQPQFLYLLCLGALLVASSTFFISFDESVGFSQRYLSGMCSAFPWFFVIGYLTMYCALFSKLWRLSKLLEMRKRVVDIQHVMMPFMLIIAGSLSLLLAWQLTDPLTWQRTVISENPLETYGLCNSPKYGVLPFAIPLGCLFAIVIAMTSVISWKLRDVQSDLCESRWIFVGIFIHIQTWAIGIPMIIITTQVSKDAWYLMYVALGFTLSVSLVSFVIFPKIYAWFSANFLPEKTKKMPRMRISVAAPNVHISGMHLNENMSRSFIAASFTERNTRQNSGGGKAGSNLFDLSFTERSLKQPPGKGENIFESSLTEKSSKQTPSGGTVENIFVVDEESNSDDDAKNVNETEALSGDEELGRLRGQLRNQVFRSGSTAVGN